MMRCPSWAQEVAVPRRGKKTSAQWWDKIAFAPFLPRRLLSQTMLNCEQALEGIPLCATLAAFAAHSASRAAYFSSRSVPTAYFIASSHWAGTTYDAFIAGTELRMKRSYRRDCKRLSKNAIKYHITDALVRLTAGLGDAVSNFLGTHAHALTRIVGGGVARSKVYTRSELEMLYQRNGGMRALRHTQYELKKIIPASWFRPEEETEDPNAIGLRLPLDMLVPKLDVQNLRDVCEIHNIFVTTRHYRSELEEMLQGHECEESVCEDSIAVLVPCYGEDRK